MGLILIITLVKLPLLVEEQMLIGFYSERMSEAEVFWDGFGEDDKSSNNDR